MWLNYKDLTKYNRVVTKQCVTNSNGATSCDGCSKSLKSNPTFSTYNSELTWAINVNLESKNLNNKKESYDIQMISNKDSNTLKSYLKNIVLPSINV